MKNMLSFRLMALVAFIVAAHLAAMAQVDVARKTTAITYPLDDTVNVPFRGTTRFPRMKGSAAVKRTTRSGTRVELTVDKMPRPFELGAGYATYVVWAISPEGQVDNLGEIKRSGLFFIDSKITVTTPLQTFALIITAEPHFLVTRPSQQIMLENLYPVSTEGKRIATTPSITYFGNTSDYFRDPRTPEIAETDYAKTPSAILQAKQAIALARFAGAERDAAPELTEAETLLQNANNAWMAGRDSDTVDIAARKSISAAVKAETTAAVRREAREKRNEKTRSDAEIRLAENKYTDAQNEIADLKSELARETRNRELAERDVQNYANQVKDLRDENGRLREDNATLRVEAENAKSKLAAMEAEKTSIQQKSEREVHAAQIRAREGDLIHSLKVFGTVSKTTRGIVLTLPENLWTTTRSGALTNQADGKLASLGEIIANNNAYTVMVESHTDPTGNNDVIQTLTENRARTVADKLAAMGVAETRMDYKGLGASMPMFPNTSAANRAKNRRVQIILSVTPQQ
ncbi:MAG: OmpA family protein [Chloracidobacterium sp.]|nr:OmpA family protein [Chloracidobacterium sp.]